MDKEKLEKLVGFFNELFCAYESTGSYDGDELEDYGVDDAKDYARARLQEYANNLEFFYSMYGEEVCEELAINVDEFNDYAKAALRELGYVKED